MQLNNRRHLFIAFSLLITLALNAIVAFFNIKRLDNNGQAVARIYTILGQLEELVVLTDDLETEERAFVATGDELALEPFRITEQKLSTTLQRLAETNDNAPTSSDFKALKRAIQNRLDRTRLVIETRRDEGTKAARAISLSKATIDETNKIRNFVTLVESRHQDTLQERSDESTQSAQDATRTFWIASGANICLLLFISRLLWRAARQNAQLEDAFANLKRAESMRDTLSAMLVHDLRTPLTTLLGPLHMLQDGSMGPLDQAQREIVAMSQTSGERLLELINELLDISKLEAGEMRIVRRKFEVSPFIQLATREVVRLESINAPHISIDVQPHCTVNGDHDLLLRVLINLLGNALKFNSLNGHVTISATLNDQETLFCVADNGEGIPTDDLAKIFDKFGQVETRKAGRKLSTGLGLTFCKLAVEAHGGRIWVESEVGTGSRFQFTIPNFEKSDIK
ncbi:hypothetical protein EON80_11955 [bacterium]|nr:MAG: hypothetical protein EON80_11955 [bacterium]